jgi:hypothetical protein
MDVWWAQQKGLEALAGGSSPYSSGFQDIYGGGAYYPPCVRDGSEIRVGFPYPPVAMLFALPSFAVAGDLRFGNAVAIAIAGVLVGHLARTRTAALAGLALLFSPRVFYVVESGWSEPAAIALFAATVWCALCALRFLPLALGLAATSKQTMPLILGLAPLLATQLRALRGRRGALVLVLLGPAVSLAAILPDLDGFLRSAVVFPAEVPLRTDVLSYPALLAHAFGLRSSGLAVGLGFGAGALAALVMLWRAPRTPAGFAAATGAALLAFYAFNKFAACNYYFFVTAALLCAVGACAPDDEPSPV